MIKDVIAAGGKRRSFKKLDGFKAPAVKRVISKPTPLKAGL